MSGKTAIAALCQTIDSTAAAPRKLRANQDIATLTCDSSS
jgi:hypothetical protein